MSEHWGRLALSLALLGISLLAHAARYQAFPTDIVALDMDSRGVVVGWTEDVDGSQRAAVRSYQGGLPLSAPVIDEPADAQDSVVTAIADGGAPRLLAGYYSTTDGVLHPVVWPWGSDTNDPSDPETLPPLAEGEDAVALDANRDHLVVGWARDSDGLEYPVYWEERPVDPEDPDNNTVAWQISRLPLPTGTLGGRATGISPGGRVGGYAVAGDGISHIALLWEADALDAQPTVLRDPQGNPAEITGLSGSFLSGWSAGEGGDQALRWRSLFASREQVELLPHLDGGDGRALAINARGETVGWSTDAQGRRRAFLYSDLCSTFDLNRLLSLSDPFPGGGEWTLTEAYAVDERNPPWITVLGDNGTDQKSFLLVPVEVEPATLTVQVVSDRPRVRVGEPLTYTIEVENSGDTYATCVVVRNTLYTGVTLLSVEAEKGRCVNRVDEAYCVVDELLPGERVRMAVRTTPRPILVDREIVNRVEVISGESDNPQAVETITPVPRDGCFIATAAYGSYLAPQVTRLRAFRDRWLRPYLPGVVDLYYRYSPPAAQWLQDHPAARPWVRTALTPVVYTVTEPRWILAAGMLVGAVGLGWRRFRAASRPPAGRRS